MKILLKEPASMTLEKLVKLIDRKEIIILLAGKRDVLPEDAQHLVALATLLAQRTEFTLFRSGNAGGADSYFKEGVVSVDPERFQAIVPFDKHMKSAEEGVISYKRISMDSINLAMEGNVLYESRRIKESQGLVNSFLEGKDVRKRGAYLIRDTLMVTGAPSHGISPASFGIFYDDLLKPRKGGTGHTMRVCDNQGVPYVDQRIWMNWLPR
jgi:hypothetical protein